MNPKTLFLGACAGMILSVGAAQAADVSIGAGSVTARGMGGMTNAMLTVSGPDNFYVQKFEKTGAPSVSLFANGDIADGVYNWELTAAKATKRPIRANSVKALDNGRGAKARSMVNDSFYASGSFRVVNGAVFTPNPNIKEKE